MHGHYEYIRMIKINASVSAVLKYSADPNLELQYDPLASFCMISIISETLLLSVYVFSGSVVWDICNCWPCRNTCSDTESNHRVLQVRQWSCLYRLIKHLNLKYLTEVITVTSDRKQVGNLILEVFRLVLSYMKAQSSFYFNSGHSC